MTPLEKAAKALGPLIEDMSWERLVNPESLALNGARAAILAYLDAVIEENERGRRFLNGGHLRALRDEVAG